MKTFLVHVADARAEDDVEFLSLFIPSVASSFHRSGARSWTVTSLLTAGQIRDRLRRWTADRAPVVKELDHYPASHFAGSEFWRHGAMFTLEAPGVASSPYHRAAA